MSRQERAASWSAIIHLTSITLLVAALWHGGHSAREQTVTINFSLQPPAPVAKDVSRPLPTSEPSRLAPRQPAAAAPQPIPEVAAKTPLDTLQPLADSPAEAVLPYQAPTLAETGSTETTLQHTAVPDVSAEQAEASGGLVEQQKTRYLLEQFAYIREAITKRTNYPYLARKNGWTGVVVVRFMIEEDGRVSEVLVDKSSGVPLLDQAATETVKSTAPFPKPPVRAEIVVPISYRLG